MRDLFETVPSDDPIAAARRGARPALRRRFYDVAAAEETDGGYQVYARRQAGAHAGAAPARGADACAGAGDRRGMGGAT